MLFRSGNSFRLNLSALLAFSILLLLFGVLDFHGGRLELLDVVDWCFFACHFSFGHVAFSLED